MKMIELIQKLTIERISTVLIGLLLVGCGGSTAAVDGTSAYLNDSASVKAMSGYYSRFMRENGNRPPKNERDFREYLASKESEIIERGYTVEEMFTSPRSDVAFQWVYGRQPPAGPMGMTFMGYEATPVDGKRLVIGARGFHEIMDDAKFRSIFPDTK